MWPRWWSFHDCPVWTKEASSAWLDTFQSTRSHLCRIGFSFIWLFSLTETLGNFFPPDPAKTWMNMPARMKMKAPVSSSNTPQDRTFLIKKEKKWQSLPPVQLVNVLIWKAVYKVHKRKNWNVLKQLISLITSKWGDFFLKWKDFFPKLKNH